MKDYYKISEISKLYGIGVDSLRYYERLGLIHPKRDTNGYRLYHLKDIYKLNLIRDLRSLDFSMDQIKAYLKDQSLDNTQVLLEQELRLIQEKIREYQQKELRIRQRINDLSQASRIEPNQIRRLSLPDRFCVRLKEHIRRDEEMDFIMQKLHRKYEKRLPDFGSQMVGAFFSMDQILQGISNVYESVFFVLDDPQDDYDFLLPAGDYLSLVYRGSYLQNGRQVRKLLSHIKALGESPEGSPFELYLIDNRDTIREEEFLTEIQVLIQADSPAS